MEDDPELKQAIEQSIEIYENEKALKELERQDEKIKLIEEANEKELQKKIEESIKHYEDEQLQMAIEASKNELTPTEMSRLAFLNRYKN